MKENIIYKYKGIEKTIPKITDKIVQEQYVLSMYLKEAQRASKNSVTLIGKHLSESIFQIKSELIWPDAKKINFS